MSSQLIVGEVLTLVVPDGRTFTVQTGSEGRALVTWDLATPAINGTLIPESSTAVFGKKLPTLIMRVECTAGSVTIDEDPGVDASTLPAYAEADEAKFLRVVNGEPAWASRYSDLLTMPEWDPETQEGFSLHVLAGTVDVPVQITVEGAFTVDWGDGTAPVDYASGATAIHTYNGADLPETTELYGSLRQAIINVTPQTGEHITSIVLGG